MATRWPWRVCQLVSSVAMKESLLWEQRSPRGKAQQVAPSLCTRGVPGDKNGHPHPGQRLGPSELVRAYPREWAGQSPLLRRPPNAFLGAGFPGRLSWVGDGAHRPFAGGTCAPLPPSAQVEN